MHRKSITLFSAALWVSAITIAGIAGSANSFVVWTVLTGVALFPPVVMMWWWNTSRQTMSQSIQEARR